jgi:hypothetical protein
MFKLRNALVGSFVIWLARKLLARKLRPRRTHSAFDRRSEGFNL